MSGLLRRLGLLCVGRPYVVVTVWVFVVLATGSGVLLAGTRTTNDITLPGTDLQGATLQGRAGRLAAQGRSLQCRAHDLKRTRAGLQRRKRRLEKDGKAARALRAELSRLLTAAGAEPRATDPRLVRIQEALARTSGVASVAPPCVNEGGSAAVLSVTATTRPADPVTAELVGRLRGTVLPAATEAGGVTVYVGGVTAAYDDLATLISNRLPLVIGVVLALSFRVLLVAFRSLLVPLKAILCNLLAVGARSVSSRRPRLPRRRGVV